MSLGFDRGRILGINRLGQTKNTHIPLHLGSTIDGGPILNATPGCRGRLLEFSTLVKKLR